MSCSRPLSAKERSSHLWRRDLCIFSYRVFVLDFHIKHTSSFLKRTGVKRENSSKFPFEVFVSCHDVYFRLELPVWIGMELHTFIKNPISSHGDREEVCEGTGLLLDVVSMEK